MQKIQILSMILAITAAGLSNPSCATGRPTKDSTESSSTNFINYEPPFFEIAYPAGGPKIGVTSLIAKTSLENKADRPFTYIHKKADGQYLLIVPEGKMFKDLKNVTIENATALWGPSTESADGIKTYDLMLSNRATVNFHLEAKFTNGSLVSYRITGPQIAEQKWSTCN